MMDLQKVRENIVGHDLKYQSPYGEQKVTYADWTASGRLYQPIEDYINNVLGPYVANTHTETTATGTRMTEAYHQAQQIIKKHVNAGPDDVIVCAGFGMTAVVNKLQRIMGMRIPERYCRAEKCNKRDKPLVILTHMEHHSNQTSWNECYCDVEIIRPGADGYPDLAHLKEILEEHKDRNLKVGSFTACSNVTGVITQYYDMAELMHEYDGYCLIDFAASAPYVKIDMHPDNSKRYLDAVFFSPHKFLGGPGSSGVMVFNKELYANEVPDHPGGGTVLWTNPWGEQAYFDNIEVREDGGTPGFLQAIRAALAIVLKEEIGYETIEEMEEKNKNQLMEGLKANPKINILDDKLTNRLGIVSFYVLGIHFNLIVKLLNDKYGIQTRGGCSCAGTYGHMLLNVGEDMSKEITDRINHGDLSCKPGWVRVSVHPTTTTEEIDYIINSINEVIEKIEEFGNDYEFDAASAEYEHKSWKRESFDLKADFAKRI